MQKIPMWRPISASDAARSGRTAVWYGDQTLQGFLFTEVQGLTSTRLVCYCITRFSPGFPARSAANALTLTLRLYSKSAAGSMVTTYSLGVPE